MANKVDLISHPIRMRLVAELGERQLTTRQLSETLPDVAQATLYRQIKKLHEGGMIEVVSEQMVNGSQERTYALVGQMARFSEAERTTLSADEHTQLFSIFAAGLIDAFTRYIEHGESADFTEQGLSYSKAVIYLSDQERVDFQREIVSAVERIMAQSPTADRKRYILASVVIPDERGAS